MENFTYDELKESFDNIVADGYAVWVYKASYNINVHVALEKKSDSGEVKTTGEAPTFSEALAKALANFPRSPLDGTAWKNKRLAAPKESSDA